MIMRNIQLEKLDNLLKESKADYAICTDAVSIESASDGAKHYGISLSETTPTLILKTKEKYYAAIICGDTRISFKKLKLALNVKDISMADPQTVLTLTGAKVGEVSLINFEMTTLVDNKILNNKDCYGGSGTSKTTLRINTDDLIRITHATVLDFTDIRSLK